MMMMMMIRVVELHVARRLALQEPKAEVVSHIGRGSAEQSLQTNALIAGELKPPEF
jgi:hypothetical protein